MADHVFRTDNCIKLVSGKGRLVFEIFDQGHGTYRAVLLKDNEFVYTRYYTAADIDNFNFVGVIPCDDDLLNVAHIASLQNHFAVKNCTDPYVSFYEAAVHICAMTILEIHNRRVKLMRNAVA
jgi:hypothetical protein